MLSKAFKEEQIEVNVPLVQTADHTMHCRAGAGRPCGHWIYSAPGTGAGGGSAGAFTQPEGHQTTKSRMVDGWCSL